MTPREIAEHFTKSGELLHKIGDEGEKPFMLRLAKAYLALESRAAKLQRVVDAASNLVAAIPSGQLGNYQDDFLDWLKGSLRELDEGDGG